VSDLTFYDHSGRPRAYCDDDETIYVFSGQPLAYIDQRAVYSFSGRFLGWLADGWIHDRQGTCVLFSQAARGGPARPVVREAPSRRSKQSSPVRDAQSRLPAPVLPTFRWTQLSFTEFFEQG
jgi:hypothetical protein